jgi:hypothetical protein
MANSRLFQFSYSYERDLVRIPLKISIGSSGAPTVSNGKGLASIGRNSAGNYTLTLKDNFFLLMGLNARFLSGASAPAAPSVNIVSESVSSSKQIIIQCRDIAGAAADPASGEIMMLEVVCRNAST